jgi:DNA-binding MarR family transcriptional regulator
MRTHILLESLFDMRLVKRLLEHEGRSIDLHFKMGSPSSSLYSSARTLLAVVGEPVALVLDAETTSPSAVSRQRQAVEEVIGSTAKRSPFRLLMAVPSLEALLFTRPALLVRAFGDRADDGGRSQELGRLSPRDAYARLDPGGPEGAGFSKLLQALDDEDVAALREESPIRELIAFLAEVGQPGMTTLINRLAGDGYAERFADPTDGRAALVRITPAGRQVLTERHAARSAALRVVIARLPIEHQAALAAALDALHALTQTTPSHEASDS